MAQHRSSPSKSGVTNLRDRRKRSQIPLQQSEITDIIPFNEYGHLADSEFCDNAAFDRESQVSRAPELDDLHDTDDLVPLRLAVPSEFRRGARHSAAPGGARNSTWAYRDSHTDLTDGGAATDVIDITSRHGAHRLESAGAIRGRLMIAAMAAGATAAAAHTVINDSDTPRPAAVLAAGESAINAGLITGSVDGMQVVTVTTAANTAIHTEELAKGAAFAQERAEREARLARPQFVMPTRGVWTSGFGFRWGVLHGGIDIANAIGTPILAAADGVVIDAGPNGGFGNWIKLRHGDGTVTVYAHLSRMIVNIGERVYAGDQIAAMGNTGNSTGPHLHFEVLVNGTDRIDPTGWLSKRGLSPGR